MTHRPARPAIAPFLAAWYLALSLLGEGAGPGGGISDVAGTIGLATLTALLAWVVTIRLFRDRSRATLGGVALVVWFGLFGTTRLLLAPMLGTSLASPGLLLLLYLVPGVLLLWMIKRLPTVSDGVIRGLTTGLTLLVLFATVTFWKRQPVRSVPAARVVADHRDSGHPDIYLIVLDKFSRPTTMRDGYGVDLTAFTDSLKALGFTIPARARTNYAHTALVLSTLLNGRMIHDMLAGIDGAPWDTTRRLIEDASLWKTTQRHGYRLAFFPTAFPGTVRNRHADLLLPSPQEQTVRFGQTWLLNTPLELAVSAACRGTGCERTAVFPYPVENAAAKRWKLSTIATLPDSAGPIFAFLHFLGSHEPYVFEGDCAARDPWWPAGDGGADSTDARRAYGEQIRCVSRLVLTAVTEIIRRSKVPPVILLQADHGNGEIARDYVRGVTKPFDEMDRAHINQRLDIFAAYRFPGADTVVPDSITPVNVLGLVFRQLYGDSTSYHPDRSYWSSYQRPLDLTEIRR